MKNFWSTFFAILAAAAVIGLVLEIKSAAEDYSRRQSQIRSIHAVTAELEKQNKLDERIRNTATARQQISFSVDGNDYTIPPGTKLEVTSNDGVNAVVHYGSAQLQVPLSNLDFSNRP